MMFKRKIFVKDLNLKIWNSQLMSYHLIEEVSATFSKYTLKSQKNTKTQKFSVWVSPWVRMKWQVILAWILVQFLCMKYSVKQQKEFRWLVECKQWVALMSRIPSIFSHSSGFPLSCVHGLDLLEGILCSELCKTLHSKASQFSSKMHFLQKKKKVNETETYLNLFQSGYTVAIVWWHVTHALLVFGEKGRVAVDTCSGQQLNAHSIAFFFPLVLKTEEHPSSLYPNRPPTTKPPVTICSLVCSMINQIMCYRQKKKQRPAQNCLSCNM